eukprot:403374752
MNKRVLLLSGGLFTVLLATFAIFQTHNDTSSFEANSAESLKILNAERSTIFTEEILQASGSTSTASKVNTTRIQASSAQTYKDFIAPADLRLTAVVKTDRLVYRDDDYIFVEVFFFYASRKTPYIPPTTSAPLINVKVQIVNQDDASILGIAQTAPLTGPTISFYQKIDNGQDIGSYKVVVTNDLTTGVRAFPSAYSVIQIRDYFSEADTVTTTEQMVLFGDGLVSTDTTFYGKILTSQATCTDVSLEVSYLKIDNLLELPETSSTVSFHEMTAYFALTFTESSVKLSRDNKIVITATGVGCTFSLIQQFTVQVPEVTPTYTINQVMVDFYSESNTDIVLNTTQKIYFNAYYLVIGTVYVDSSLNEYEKVPLDIVNGAVKAYEIADPYSTLLTLVADVDSDLNGFGSFSVTVPDGYMPFLQFTLAAHATEEGNALGLTLPYQDIITLSGGVVRAPIVPYSIAKEQKEIVYQTIKSVQDAASELLVETLQSWEFYNELIPDTDLSLTLEEGLFIISDGNQQTLAQFNQFPNPAHFTKTVLFSYVMEYPTPGTYNSIDVSVKSYNFENVILSMASLVHSLIIDDFGTDYSFTNLAIVATDSSTLAISMCSLFRQVAYKPYAEITIYNEDGPVEQIIDGSNGYEFLGDTSLETVTFEKASIQFSLNKNILESQDSLVITFNTNELVDTTDAYLLTIKQKEKIYYAEAFSFSKNTNQKRTIAYGKLNRMNGGVFSVDLYRITDEYLAFQTSTTASAYEFCDLNTIESKTAATYTAQSLTTRLGQVDDVHSKSVLSTPADILSNNLLTLTTPQATALGFTSCIVNDPIISDTFVKQVASSQFFRKPQPAIDVEVASSKVDYMQGEQISVTVSISNKTDNLAISSGAYLSIVVTEEADYIAEYEEMYTRSIANELYTENDIDETDIPFSIDEVINKPYDGNSAANLALEYVLARQRFYNKIYEVDALLTYDYLTMHEKADLLPSNADDLSRAFGYFFPDSAAILAAKTLSGTDFAQTDIFAYFDSSILSEDRYISGWQNSYHLEDNIDSLIDPINLKFGSTQGKITSAYGQTLPTGYKRDDGKYIRETIYFQSGILLTSQSSTVTFNAGDLPSNYKIRAVVVHPNGFGYAENSFTVIAPFEVELEVPSVMVAGETYTVYASVYNFGIEKVNVTLQRFESTLSPNQQYQDGYEVVYVNLSSLDTEGYEMEFVQVESGTAEIIEFSLVVSEDIDTDTETKVNLMFSAAAYPTANTALINNTYSKEILIDTLVIVPKPKAVLYFSGEITTDNDAAATSDSASFTFTTPDLSAVSGMSANLTLHAGAFSLINTLAQQILDDSSPYINAHELIASIDVLDKYSFIISDYPATSTGQSYFYQDRFFEINIKINQLYDQLQEDFQIKDSTTGECMGWDYFTNESENGGSMVLTAYALDVITRIQDVIFVSEDLDLDILDDQECYQQSLQWILNKQKTEIVSNVEVVAGNFTFDSLDIDAHGRAPWNVSQAFITYSLINTELYDEENDELVTPDLSAQILFLVDQITGSYTTESDLNIRTLLTDSDPYYLGIAALALQRYTTDADVISKGYSDATELGVLEAQASAYVKQVLFNQFNNDIFGLVHNNSIDNFHPSFSYTPFNSYGTDRIVETTAICLQAIINDFNLNTNTYGVELYEGLEYLRSELRGDRFGSLMSTIETYQTLILLQLSNLNQLHSSSLINLDLTPFDTDQIITVGFTVTTPDNVDVPIVNTQTITKVDYELPTLFYDFASAYNFDYETEYDITFDLSSNAAAGTKDFVFTWSAVVSYYDEEFTGPDQEDSKISLAVQSNGDINSKDIGDTVPYTINLYNLDRGRSHNGAVFILRFSPCLEIDTDILDDGVEFGDYSAYVVNEESHSVMFYARGISPFGFPTFTIGFEKVYEGNCVERPSSVYLSGNKDSYAHAYPVDVNP